MHMSSLYLLCLFHCYRFLFAFKRWISMTKQHARFHPKTERIIHCLDWTFASTSSFFVDYPNLKNSIMMTPRRQLRVATTTTILISTKRTNVAFAWLDPKKRYCRVCTAFALLVNRNGSKPTMIVPFVEPNTPIPVVDTVISGRWAFNCEWSVLLKLYHLYLVCTNESMWHAITPSHTSFFFPSVGKLESRGCGTGYCRFVTADSNLLEATWHDKNSWTNAAVYTVGNVASWKPRGRRLCIARLNHACILNLCVTCNHPA